MKVRRLKENDIQRMVKRVLNEQLTQTQLTSPKSKQAKKFQEVFNSLYKSNLPVDGNWKDKKYNELKKKWLNEKVFVDIYGRVYGLSDVPMTYMLRKESFKKRKLSKKEIDYLYRKSEKQ